MPSLETLTPEKSVSPNEAKDLRFNRHKTVIPNKVKDLRSNHHKSVILSKAKDLRLNPHKTVILNKSKDLRFNHHKSVIPKPTVSLGLANPPPILAGANDRNALDRMQIEKIAIDADQQGALARDGWPQHRHVFRIAADLDWQVGRRNDHRGSAKEAADPIHIFLRKAEFLKQLPGQLPEDEVEDDQFVVEQNMLKQLRADPVTADVRRNQHRGIDGDSHGY